MDASENPGSGLIAAQSFNTTHWSVVLKAGNRTSPESSTALEMLCRTYWQPLFVFARRKGYLPEDAQDLTQEFFARLLERNDFETVDPRKGKFRTFLLTSFTHFLSNERDRAGAAKRGGGRKIFSLDELQTGQLDRLGASGDLPADSLFDLHWAVTVMERALAHLQQEMEESGKAQQFAQLKRFLTEEPSDGDYAAVAQALNVVASSVAVTAHRLRQRFRESVRSEVAQTVTNPLELEEEMRHLCAVLARA